MSSRNRNRVRALACLSVGICAALSVRADAPLSDPTRPEVALPVADPEKPATHTLALHAILHGEGRRLAVVNGQRVDVGDVVDGARVLAIEADHVRLRRDGETLVIELVSPVFKRVRERARAESRFHAVPRAETAPAPRGPSK